jgi:transposase
MPMGRPKADLVLRPAEHAQLQSMVRSRSISSALQARAQIVLASAGGEPNSSIAARLGFTNATVGKWRRRFIERRITGLYDELRPGKPRTIDDERVAELIQTTLHSKPVNGATHWSVRTLAAETGISRTSVHRYIKLFGLQPHRSDTCKLSTDPFFIEKLRDVVGLYLNPPDKALVLCVDEKSQVQALERTQPLLPMGFGYVEGVTHDYKRHGTTTLFAALDVLTGQVLAQCKPRHRHQEFLGFLRAIEAAVPPELDVHLIVDNYSTHKHAKVKAWLAARPRWHLHFVPTYSSWLNLVERFFALITDKASAARRSARCGSWCSTLITLWPIITWTANPSSGQPPLIRSSRSSKDFAHESAGRHTRQKRTTDKAGSAGQERIARSCKRVGHPTTLPAG